MGRKYRIISADGHVVSMIAAGKLKLWDDKRFLRFKCPRGVALPESN